MPQHIQIPVICRHAKIRRIRRVPPIINLLHPVFIPVCKEAQGALIGSLPRIARHSHLAHRLTRSALYASPSKTTIVVKYIHTSKPMAAATPP